MTPTSYASVCSTRGRLNTPFIGHGTEGIGLECLHRSLVIAWCCNGCGCALLAADLVWGIGDSGESGTCVFIRKIEREVMNCPILDVGFGGIGR